MIVGRIAIASVVCVVACGRVDFDPRGGDAAPDTSSQPCAPGTQVAGVAVADVSMSAPGDACAIDNALALDGAVAGLDRSNVVCGSAWDPQGSCGCIAVDLGAVYSVGTLSIWAGPSGDACGKFPCTSCGTGDVLGVAIGTSAGAYTRLDFGGGGLSLTSSAITRYSFPVSQSARYVVLCRVSYGQERDDIVVDYVSATCQ